MIFQVILCKRSYENTFLYHLPGKEILPSQDNTSHDYTDHQQIVFAKPFEIVNADLNLSQKGSNYRYRF